MFYLIFALLIVANCPAYVDITIKPKIEPWSERSVNIVKQNSIGAGFFCLFGGVIGDIIHYEQDGIRSLYVDWTHEFFPFKDAPHENGWNLYFEPVVVDTSKINLNEPVYQVIMTPINWTRVI